MILTSTALVKDALKRVKSTWTCDKTSYPSQVPRQRCRYMSRLGHLATSASIMKLWTPLRSHDFACTIDRMPDPLSTSIRDVPGNGQKKKPRQARSIKSHCESVMAAAIYRETKAGSPDWARQQKRNTQGRRNRCESRCHPTHHDRKSLTTLLLDDGDDCRVDLLCLGLLAGANMPPKQPVSQHVEWRDLALPSLGAHQENHGWQISEGSQD